MYVKVGRNGMTNGAACSRWSLLFIVEVEFFWS